MKNKELTEEEKALATIIIAECLGAYSKNYFKFSNNILRIAQAHGLNVAPVEVKNDEEL